MFKPEIPYTLQSIKAIIERSEQRCSWPRREVVSLKFYGVFDANTKRLLKHAILELRDAGERPDQSWYEVANQTRIAWVAQSVYNNSRACWKSIKFPWRKARDMRLLGLDRKKMKK